MNVRPNALSRYFLSVVARQERESFQKSALKEKECDTECDREYLSKSELDIFLIFADCSR
jgi:hypothetical protein